MFWYSRLTRWFWQGDRPCECLVLVSKEINLDKPECINCAGLRRLVELNEIDLISAQKSLTKNAREKQAYEATIKGLELELIEAQRTIAWYKEKV